MRRLDRAFDRLASRGRRSDPEDVIDRLERRLAGEPEVVRIPGRPEMERTETKVTRRRGLLIAATAMAAALVVALPLWFLWQGDDSAVIGQETTTTLGTITTTGTATTTAAPTTTTVPTTTALTPGVLVSPLPPEVADWTGSHSLVAVSASEMWIVVDGRIGRLQDGAWTFHRPTPEALVREVAVAPDGTVWAATDQGVWSFDGEEWTRQYFEYYFRAQRVAVAEDGTVWVAAWAPLSLARWDGESWVRVHPARGAPGGAISGPMAVSPNGRVWMAVYVPHTDALLSCDGATCDEVQIGDYPEGTHVQVDGVEAAPNGDIWVGGGAWQDPELDGVVEAYASLFARFDGEAWTTYGPAESVCVGLAVGPNGVVWCLDMGALRWFDGTTWSTPIEGVHDVDVAPDGTVWYVDDQGFHTIARP